MKKQLILFTILSSFSFFGFAQNSTDKNLSELIEKKRSFNENIKTGYCIQLYNGNEKKAISTMEEFSEFYPEIAIKRIYKVPEWKVQTECYKTKLEADRVLNLIKFDYPGARVL